MCISTMNAKSIPFTGSIGDQSEIITRFKIVATNVHCTSIGAILSQAQVILVGERHLESEDNFAIAKIINNFDPGAINVLLEDNLDRSFQSMFPGIKNTKSWDSKTAANELSVFYKVKLVPLFYDGLSLLACFSKFLQGETLSRFFQNILLKLDPTIPIIDQTPKITLESFRNAAITWLMTYQELLDKRASIIDRTFPERNSSLIKSVQENLSTADSKIILIAGASHIVPSKKREKSVNIVYDALTNSSIPYVALSYKTSIDEYRSPADLLNEVESIASTFHGARYPLDMLVDLNAELRPMLGPITITTPAIDSTLIRIAIPIYTMKLMR